MVNYIFITTRFEGYHQYPDAPKEVEFLKDRHRHMFGVKVWVEVHNNEDIEPIIFKRDVAILLRKQELNDMSCQMISDYLYDNLSKNYLNRKFIIEVSEDNELGSFKKYEGKKEEVKVDNEKVEQALKDKNKEKK